MSLERYSAAFEGLRGELPGPGEPRRRALERFLKAGFPTTEDEAWRFTDVRALAEAEFRPAPPRPEAPVSPSPLGAARLVFVNGRFVPALSDLAGLGAGARVEPLSRALGPGTDFREEPGAAFADLNAALFSDGARVVFEREGADVPEVHLAFLAAPDGALAMTHVRVQIVARPGARGRVIEEHAGPAGVYFSNAVTEVALEEGAALEHVRLEREGADAFHVSSLRARLAKDSRFDGHVFSFGAALARVDTEVRLSGLGAQCRLGGLLLASGSRHVDCHTLAAHEVPHGSTEELYKAVLGGQARAVFDGAVEVRPGAQKAQASVHSKNLLVSEKALVNTKPEFKIHANDVQCRHGATVGQLSADALFYLRSRGIGADEARALLVHAFAGEMIDKAPGEKLRGILAGLIDERLP